MVLSYALYLIFGSQLHTTIMNTLKFKDFKVSTWMALFASNTIEWEAQYY